MEKKNAWKKYKEEDLKKLNDLCDDYKRFLTVAKTERESANEIIKRAEEKGYQDLEKYISEGRRILPGDKVLIEMSPYDLTKGRIIWRAK